MARFHFHICENDQMTPDSDGHELADPMQVRREAVETGLGITREALLGGRMASGHRVLIHVDRENDPFLKVSIALEIEERMDDTAAGKKQPRRLPPDFRKRKPSTKP